MTEALDAISSQLKAIQSEVVEFNVGVSHLALDEERERYTRIRERIESIIGSLSNSQIAQGKYELENARRLLTAATGNTATLRYLESISCLESIFTDVTKAATVTAVGLSSEDSIPERVLASRLLTENVKHCWEYAAQLSELTAIHLKSSADFHIFNHEVNEVRAHAAQMKIDSANQLKAFSPDGRIMEATSLSDEMNERLNAFQDLADRARSLASRAPSILPVENRLIEVREGVAKNKENYGPLMVQMLIDYVGSNFTVRKGDSLPLLNTRENPNLWKVMTQSGPQYIPSIACIIASANGSQVHDAFGTLAAVKDAWNDSLENYRRQLAIYYSKYLQSVIGSRNLHVTDLNSKRRFLEDLDRLLVQSGTDEGRLANILEMIATRTDSIPEQAEQVWNRTDLNILHQPLLVLYEHIKALRQIDENIDSFTTRMRDYASTVATETRGLQAQLENLRLTHDRNRAELKKLYDRVHNWKSIHTDFLDRPPSGMGRLVVSSASTSSGISSEEIPAIPQPPSPFGRITPIEEVESDASVREFLETKPQRRFKMKSVTLGIEEEPHIPKVKVFACGAVKHSKQIEATANVKQVEIEKPKMIRDVATNTPIKNIQTATSRGKIHHRYAGTQSETKRVDSMTQIGWIKAQKAQQVDGSIISAALEVSEPNPSYASAIEGASPQRLEKTFTTGPQKEVQKLNPMLQIDDSGSLSGTQVGNFSRASEALETEPQSLDSATFETHVSIETLDFEVKKKSREIITQIDQITKKSDKVTQPDSTHSIDAASKPKYKVTALQMNPQELVWGFADLRRTFSNAHLQSELERVSNQLETVPQPSKSFDAEAQIFYQPKVSGMLNVKRQQTSASQQKMTTETKQENKEPTPYYGLDADDRSLSDIDLHFKGKEIVELAVVNSGKPKVAAECTCVETSHKQIQAMNNLTSCSFSCALHDPISFHFNTPCYASCETPRIQIDTASDKKRPILTADTGLHHMNVNKASKLHDTSATPSKAVQSQVTAFKGPRVCTEEMDSKIGQADNTTMTVTPNVGETELTATLNNNQRIRETVIQSTCPICNCQLETSWPSTAITETFTTKRSTAAKSTQVGTVLEPVKVQVVEVISKPKAPPEVRSFGMEVQNILCPSTVELVSSLAETSGIKVKDVCEVDAININKGESTFHANVRKRIIGATSVPNAHALQGSIDRRWIGTVLGEASTVGKKSDASSMTDKLIIQQAKFEIKCSNTVNENNEIHNGTEKKLIASLETSNRSKTSAPSSTFQPVTYQEIETPAKASIECQVGAILRPTRVYLANVEIKARTPELARLMAITPNAIICPSTVELQTELVEHAGIQVMDVKDVSNMEFETGTALCEASFNARSSEGRRQSIAERRPFMKNINIARGKSGLTIGQAEVQKAVAKSIQNMKTFALQDVGCEFAIKNTSIGTICGHCLGTGRAEHSVIGISSEHSTSIDLSRKPSFIHQRAIAPLSKAVECQVGIVLRPKAIQVSNIGVKPRSRIVAEYLGMNVDSVLCPAKVQMVPELRETPGIEVMNVTDTAHLDVQAGEAVIEADIQTGRSLASAISMNSQRKPHLLLNLKANPNALTIGQSSSHVPVKSISTMGENFTLNDVGCEVVLRDNDFSRICVNCQGTGRMKNASVQSLPIPFKTANLKTSQQYSSLIPATMVSKSVHTESKSCQVGTILMPTSVNIASVEMLPKSTTSAVSSTSVVYPASIELESKLTETSGIQIKEVANMETVSVSLGQEFAASVHRKKPVPETCVLEVISSHSEAVRGGLSTVEIATSSGKFNLQNIGCEFRLKEATTSSTPIKNPHPLVSTFGTRIPVESGLKRTSVPRSKHASSQVGLSLIPKTVQIADMSVNATDKQLAASLGLKADAVICPSTVDLEMKLTETAGITVTDVKDVREVRIKVGENRGVISIAGRNIKAVDSDAACLIFVSNNAAAYNEIRPPFTKVQNTGTSIVSKTFDQRARCTFQVRQASETNFQLRPSQEVKKSNVGCQVGVLMVPKTMKVSSVKMAVEEKASADTMGVSIPSALQASTYELEPRISEIAGIQTAQMNDVQQVQLQIGGQVFTASVISGFRIQTRTTTSRTWGRPVTETAIPSSIQFAEANVSNIIGPYLLNLKEGATENHSIVEVTGLTLGGKSLLLRVNADLRGKLTMQTGHTNSGRRFSGFLDPSQRPTSASERSISGRPNSRLCDVACEALIKPETLEKRIQAFFM